ncbi:MAG: cytochrome c maturation protein CcmE [Alphaproteobacteria bacterium]|nr:cytochrome c maturation protein CcmE [Alphaproteobacteria bacterium]MDH5555898.1 cytochrome c maturation protein CcmE [Alphaproteobacteria bacterium]
MTNEATTPKSKTSRAATRKTRRLYIVLIGMTMLGLAAGLVLFAFQDSLVFFYTPSDVVGKDIKPGQRVRLGGLVAEGSVEKDGTTVRFVVTDMMAELPVSYTGILPDLFREGQGVVAEGSLLPNGSLEATSVLAKHDENYMPKEVAEKLKESGRWQEEETQ